MTHKFLITRQAEEDLFEIWDYLAQSSIDAADRVRDKLEEAMNQLAEFPGIGHMRLDLADERHRFWLVHPYLIVYIAAARPIEVIRIIHSARDFPALD